MKAGLATSLSIAGVLATGGAALVLNSSILDTESAAKGSPAFATVVGIEAQGGITPLGGNVSAGSAAELSASGIASVLSDKENEPTNATVTASDSPSDPIESPTTTVARTFEKQFKVGEAATITLVTNGNRLLVKDIAIVPGSGYHVTNQSSRDGDDVRITLTSPDRAVEFSARLVNGQIMAAVSAPSSGNLNRPRPPHRDDDDHEERERREHADDEDHDEGEDHDEDEEHEEGEDHDDDDD
jgi:hypothetical protein